MLWFVILVSMIVSTFAQKCDQGEVDKFYQCLEKSRPQHSSHSDQGKHSEQQGGHKFDRGTAFADFQKKREECYTKNNCKAPQPEKHQAINDTTKQCFKTNFEAFKTCVNGKGAHFPKPHSANDTHKQWSGEHGHFGGGQRGAGRVDPKDCPAAAAVQSCLASLRPTGSPRPAGNHTRPNKEEMKQRFEKMCSAKKACISAMPQSCQDLLTKTKKDLCDCATAQKPRFQKCFGSDTKKGREDRMLKDICEDRCAKESPEDRDDDN